VRKEQAMTTVKPKRNETCRCNAYAFPHRKQAGKCQGPEYVAVTQRDKEWGHENAVFNATERRSA
jgi:hypothetical protein